MIIFKLSLLRLWVHCRIPPLPLEAGQALEDNDGPVWRVGQLLRAHPQVDGLRNEKVNLGPFKQVGAFL